MIRFWQLSPVEQEDLVNILTDSHEDTFHTIGPVLLEKKKGSWLALRHEKGYTRTQLMQRMRMLLNEAKPSIDEIIAALGPTHFIQLKRLIRNRYIRESTPDPIAAMLLPARCIECNKERASFQCGFTGCGLPVCDIGCLEVHFTIHKK